MEDADMLAWSEQVAEEFLAPLGTRFQHVSRVVQAAREVGEAYGASADQLTAAAFLHDIGYAPRLAGTGFHPLDGARFVRSQGMERIARLVAHHSGARYEARLRGIKDYEDEFPFEASELDQALTYCDLTTGPDGSRVSLEERRSEIAHRYGPRHTVTRALILAADELTLAVAETERRVRCAGIRVSGS